ncbi:MAG: hypothetical protein ACKV2Q_01455 [Planctomycetaceae bacterium]
MTHLKWITAALLSFALIGCGNEAAPPKTPGPTENKEPPAVTEKTEGPATKPATNEADTKPAETATTPTTPAEKGPAQAEAAVANPLTLVMTIKSKEDEAQLKALLTKMLIASPTENPVTQAMNKLGIVHDARFVFLDGKLLVITTYDHDFETYIDTFVKEIGHIFDALLVHMADAPKLPVKDNADEFLAYVQKNDLKSFTSFYSGYPSLSRKDVVELAQKANVPVEGSPVANPLTLVLTIKSPEDAAQLRGVLTKLSSGPPHSSPVDMAMNKLGLVHFARFVFFENDTKLLVITTYDNDFEQYIDSFTKEIGPIFDVLLSHSKDAPMLPVQQNSDAFLEYVGKNDLKSFGTFYSGYPALLVPQIRALQQPAATPAEPTK